LEGLDLALTYSSNASAVETLMGEIHALTAARNGRKLNISKHQVDLSDVKRVEEVYEEVKSAHDGKVVDVLVSNAGELSQTSACLDLQRGQRG